MFPYLHTPTYKLGPFTIQAFGLLVATAVIIGTTLIRRRAEEMKLDADISIDSFFWILPGGFIISHVFSVLAYSPDKVLKNPMLLLYVWAGISSYGGILGGFAVAAWYFHKRKVPLMPYLEATAYGFFPAFMVGRFACAVAHDHPGRWVANNAKFPSMIASYGGQHLSLPPFQSTKVLIAFAFFTLLGAFLVSRFREKPFLHVSTLLAAVVFAPVFYFLYQNLPSIVRSLAVSWPVNWSEIPAGTFQLIGTDSPFSTRFRYDLGLMEALYLILLSIMVFLSSLKRRPLGFRIGTWFVMYAPMRFFFEFLRTSTTDRRYYGLTPAQYLSFLVFGIGLYFLLTLREEREGDYVAPLPEEESSEA